MDFGVVGLEAFVGPEGGGGGGSSHQVSDHETKPRGFGFGSGLVKQDDWRISKMSKSSDGLSAVHKAMRLHQGTPLLRSNALSSGDGRQQEHMLSFSSVKSEVPFLSKDGGVDDKSTHTSVFPYFQRTPSSYTRNAGYGSGSLNASMHGNFAGVRGPFTPSQWMELEHQALIYKYITSNVPVPSNLLIPLKRSLNPYGLSGSNAGSLPHNSIGWGSFHLGFSGNADPEPGRCRRTDGKKWRCSRDAVADQKYCERHINRGRHRSRKPVEGQTGHAVSGTTSSKVVPMTSSMSTPVIPSGGASNSLAVTQHQFKSLQPGGAANPSTDALVNRENVCDRSLSIISSTISLKSNESTFTISKQGTPLNESSQTQSEFGLVSTDSLLNPSHRSSYLNSKNYGGSFLDFNDQETQDQHPLRQFIDDWPKDQLNRSVISWPEELKSDWTQLSMSIPMASSDFSSSSSSPTQEKFVVSPLRLSCEFEPIQINLGMGSDLSEPTHKQTNWIPISWGTSMGGPLGEVLTNTTSTVKACKNSSALNLLTEGWDGSSQLRSSPTGVLQNAPFSSLSNSSSGSSPRAENGKSREGASLYDDVLGSTLASTSIPSL